MSISRICYACKSTFKPCTLQCPNCQVNLSKFKVRVRVGQGWKTLVTESLEQAQEFNERFRSSASKVTPEASRVTPESSKSTPHHQQQEVTLKEVFDSFLTWAETHKRTWRSDLQLFELRLSPLSSLPLSRITPEMVQELIDSLKSVRKEGGRLAPATKLQAAALIRRLFGWAKKRRMWIGENPIQFIELEKFDNRRERYLSQGELQRLLSELDRDCNPTRDR